MIQLGDLPHRDVNGKWDDFAGLPQEVLEAVGGNTEHTETSKVHRFCHRCEKKIKTFVCKPGSPFSWCLECF